MSMHEDINYNRKYKDGLFRFIFNNKEAALSLYNAINNSTYQDSDQLEIYTMNDFLYMGMKNDLAFIMDMNLYLYEHQSTYNPNIPLRNLFYIADEYQRLVVRKSLYSTVIQKIPTPRFLVFYNGTKEVEDRSEFRLSSAYENPTENPDLELRVTILNVNDGHSSDLMEHCRTLKEYAQYVARVRKYAAKQDVSLEEAVTRAVDECIEEGILAEFLLKNKTEVIKVSIYEYDKEFEEKKLRKAEYEAGRQDGIEIGRQDGLEIGRQDGIEIGRQDGIEIGKRILLEKIIKKKLKKGKSTEQIADELEEDINIIQKVVEKLKSQI